MVSNCTDLQNKARESTGEPLLSRGDSYICVLESGESVTTGDEDVVGTVMRSVQSSVCQPMVLLCSA